jgi:osmotically-inducible protein OsmY
MMKPKSVGLGDKNLREAVEQQLDYDPAVQSKNVGVSVSEGVVSLSGYVETYADKIIAEKAAKRVRGVKAMANDIEVRPPSEYIDPDIAADAVKSLERNVHVPSERISVTVKDGWLTIEGKVSWGYQKEAAEQAVRYLPGVRGVTNKVEIAPVASAADVRTKIEEALRRSAEVDAHHIKVDASGGAVTLSGKVRSWSEMKEAEGAAWGAPGVNEVLNLIEIVS